jgi:hypothetical protein
MSGARRKVVIGLSIAAAVVIGAAVLLVLFFPTEMVRDRAVAELEERLGRPVSVEGVGISIFPPVGADLTGVSIGERAEPGRPRIALESVRLQVRLLPLLRRRIEIKRVDIEGLQVDVLLGEPKDRASATPHSRTAYPMGPRFAHRPQPDAGGDGSLRASPPQSPPTGNRLSPGMTIRHAAETRRNEARQTTAAKDDGAGKRSRDRYAFAAVDSIRSERAPKETRPFSIDINALTLREGSVRVRSSDGDPLLELGGISEDLKAEGTSAGDLRLKGRTRIDSLRVHLPAGELGRGMRLRLEKELHYDRSSDLLEVEAADLDLNGLAVSISGTAASLSSGPPTVDLEVKGGPGEVSDIAGYLPSAMFPRIREMKSEGTVSVQGSIRGPLSRKAESSTGERLDFNFDLDLSDGRIVHPDLSAPIEGIELRANVTPGTADIADLTAVSGTSRVKARAKISDYDKDPTVDAALDADVDLAEVSALHPVAGDYGLRGRAAAKLSVRGPAKTPGRMAIAGVIDLNAFGFRPPEMKHPVSDVAGRVLIDDKDLTLASLTGKMGSSDFSAEGTLSYYPALRPGAGAGAPANINLTVHSGLLALDELTSPDGKEKSSRSGRESSSAGEAERGDSQGGDAESDRPSGSERDASEPEAKTERSAEASAAPAKEQAASSAKEESPLAALTGRIEFSADRIRTKDIAAGPAEGLALMDRGLIRIERLELGAFGGKAAVQGTVDMRGPREPGFDLVARIEKMRASDLFTSVSSLKRFSRAGGLLSGEVDANATLKGDLNEAKNLDLSTLTSIGDLSVSDAKLNEHPIQVRLADYLETPQLKTLEISDWFQPFRIENGRLHVEGLSIKTEKVSVTVNGWQSLDGSVEMDFEVLLPRELSEGVRKEVPKELVPVLFDEKESRVLVPLNVTGSYEAPRVALDSERLTAAARAQAKKKLEEESGRLKEEAERRAEGFLKGLMDAPADTSAVEKKSGEVEKKIKDSLKDLFKKKGD